MFACIKMFRLMSILAFLISACTPESVERKSRPTDDGEGNPGFLESTEKDVIVSEETEVVLGNTSIKIPAGAAATNFRVRISNRVAKPDLQEAESLVLGDVDSPSFDVDFYDADANVTLSTTDLLTEYELRQTFSSSDATSNIGLMVITDAGTSAEKRGLLLNHDLNIESGGRLSLIGNREVVVRVLLRLTAATLWLVSYTEDALTTINIVNASSLMSVGGSAIEIKRASSTTKKIISDASISINSGEGFATSGALRLSLTATGAIEMLLSNRSDCSSSLGWQTFSPVQDWTLTSLNTVARVYAKFRTADGTESFCVKDSIIHDDVKPSAPGIVQDGAANQSLTASPMLAWTASTDSGSGIAYYEVAIGTISGGTDIMGWTNVGNITSTQLSGLSLTTNTAYFPSVRAVDVAGLISTAATGDGWTATSGIDCSSGHGTFIPVPANPDIGVNEPFCVAKYEMKSVASMAASQPTGTPWGSITRNNARVKCDELSGGIYRLISNARWQAVARSIENRASNWSGGAVGNGDLNFGHSDSSPDSVLPAAADDNASCSSTGHSCDLSTWHDQRRTHTLSNGEIIWDFAGNAGEWVYDQNSASQGGIDFISQNPATDKSKWGPLGNYVSKNSGAYGGLGYGDLNWEAGGIFRGGTLYGGGNKSGVYSADLRSEPVFSNYSYIGFRCVLEAGQ